MCTVRSVRAALLGVLVIAVASPACATPQYRLIDLGTLGGSYSSSWDLTNDGTVVGSSYVPNNSCYQAFVCQYKAPGCDNDGGVDPMTNIGETFQHYFSQARGVNSTGLVVGFAFLDSNNGHAVAWDNYGSLLLDLGTLGGSASLANGVNDNGEVVGEAFLPGDTSFHAFVWDPDNGMQDLGSLGGYGSCAQDISESRIVVGWSLTDTGEQRAFWWDADDGMTDLPTLGGTQGNAQAINDQGQIVGCSNIGGDSETHAALWTLGGELTDLGTLGGSIGVAHSINSNGVVVGYSTLPDGVRHGFIWHKAHPMRDLNSLIEDGSAWTITEANCINDNGWIAATATDGGATHAVLLLPY